MIKRNAQGKVVEFEDEAATSRMRGAPVAPAAGAADGATITTEAEAHAEHDASVLAAEAAVAAELKSATEQLAAEVSKLDAASAAEKQQARATRKRRLDEAEAKKWAMLPHPFLKWAGGKRQLLPELLRRVPAAYGTYYEPFLGGGALFFALKPARAVLSDANEELMAAYAAVCDNPEAIVRELRTMEDAHSRDPRGTYDYLRSVVPSPLHSSVYNAARMIYLNKTCFNGLYRVNKSGLFNVPMGKFARPPVICDAANLRACSDALKKNIELKSADFKAALMQPKVGDFVYLDPPYVPRSDSSNFTAFTKEGFGATDQADLAKIARRLKEDGVHILLSNSGTKEVRDLYPEPFFKVEEVKGRRNINSHWEGRCALVEYLIS